MTWADDLTKIRRFLRDPDGKVWSEPFLRHMYNDVAQDFNHRTMLLEKVDALRVPGLFQGSYLHSWEQQYVDAQFGYRALTSHHEIVICAPWEAQEVTSIASDATDPGAHFTQPWEAYMTTPGDLIRFRWPQNLNMLLFIAYDDDAIEGTTLKRVQSHDSSYVTTQGTPTVFYPYDQKDYVLYPRPSVGFYNELDSEGAAWFAEGDTEDATTGTIAIRTASYDGDDGLSVDIIDSANNLLIIYRASPADVQTAADESSIPEFLRRYVIAGTIGRAYGANTDGRIRSLGELWEARYELGVQLTKRYLRNRRQDRDYRMRPSRPLRRGGGRPRLPDTYPAV